MIIYQISWWEFLFNTQLFTVLGGNILIILFLHLLDKVVVNLIHFANNKMVKIAYFYQFWKDFAINILLRIAEIKLKSNKTKPN
jgi:hypothetical protein